MLCTDQNHGSGTRQARDSHLVPIMILTVRTILCLIGLGLLMILAGCQSTTTRIAMADHMRYPPIEGRQRSMVFASAQVRQLSTPATQHGDGKLPWYTYRNDEQVTIYSGVQTETTETTSTFVYEKLQQNGSHVHDHVQIRTYRSNITESSR